MLALLAGHWLVPASAASRRRRLDLAGAALAAAGFTALAYTLIQAPGAGWASAATLLRAVITVGLLGALTAVELHSGHPMIQLALFRNSRHWVRGGCPLGSGRCPDPGGGCSAVRSEWSGVPV